MKIAEALEFQESINLAEIALNKAISNASNAGLKTEVGVIRFQETDREFEQQSINVTVTVRPSLIDC